LVFPFHIWAPDVYQGSSYSILFFIAVLSKIPVFRFFWGFFYFAHFSNLFYLFSFLTLLCGTFGAIFQSSMKRFLAYASMSHTAFLLRCFPSFSLESFLFYLIFYIFTTFGVITVLFSLVRWKTDSELDFLDQLRWSFSSRPIVMFLFSLLFLSLAGIPPLSGFFAKFFVIRSIALDSFWILSFFFLFLSLFSLYYYLGVISRSQLGFVKYPTLFRPLTYSSSIVLVFCIFFTFFFPFFFNSLFWFLL
jgi:NADH-quinone oxidoreductase subunit N